MNPKYHFDIVTRDDRMNVIDKLENAPVCAALNFIILENTTGMSHEHLVLHLKRAIPPVIFHGIEDLPTTFETYLTIENYSQNDVLTCTTDDIKNEYNLFNGNTYLLIKIYPQTSLSVIIQWVCNHEGKKLSALNKPFTGTISSKKLTDDLWKHDIFHHATCHADFLKQKVLGH